VSATVLTAEMIVDAVDAAAVRVSPDGRWVAYELRPAGGVWLAGVDAVPRKLSDGGKPRWAPDSRSVYVVEGTSLHRLDLTGLAAVVLSWDAGIDDHLPLADGVLFTAPDAPPDDIDVRGPRPSRLRIADADGIRVLYGNRHVDAVVQQPGGGPLVLNITGANGGPAQTMNLTIDAPGCTNVGQFSVTDATVTTNGGHFSIASGNVPGKLVLTMPGQVIVLDNRSPVPVVGPSVQMYGPGSLFNFSQDGFTTTTSNYVVSYGVLSAITALGAYPGMAFVRDVPRDMKSGDGFDVQGGSSKSGPALFYILGLSPTFMLDILQAPKPVESPADGKPVNLSGLQ